MPIKSNINISAISAMQFCVEKVRFEKVVFGRGQPIAYSKTFKFLFTNAIIKKTF